MIRLDVVVAGVISAFYVSCIGCLMVLCAGCSFQVGIGYHGKTGIHDQEITPAFRGVKEDKDGRY